MARINVAVSLEWNPVGEIQLDENGKLVFPKTPIAPGLYRFDLAVSDGSTIYVGETEQLAQRLQQYRTPGRSQRTNLRLNALMRAELSGGRAISLATITDESLISLDGEERPADLSRKSERVLLENAALYEAFAAGITVLNA